MRYVKATMIGIAFAVVTALTWGIAALVVPILAGVLMSYVDGEGAIGVGASSVGEGSVLLAGLFGFVAGFYWTLRRSRRLPL